MRKQLKMDILDCLDTIYSGLEWCTENKNADSLSQVLGDCFAAIEMVCTLLESDTDVSCHELAKEQRDCLTQWRQTDIQKDSDDIYISYMNMVLSWKQKMLDISEVLEIVFLPYKASMWDSLESIYMAARNDPGCHAVVVPIPYYEKNSDGTLHRMVYEGELYPEDIPIIHYTDYDLKSRCPDIIYIHNAYDNDNFVTTVNEEYYTDRLCNDTQMLVYVPYFMVMDDLVGSHLCLVKGLQNVERIIVQSEKVREQYIEYWAPYMDISEKIIALGSPKCDVTDTQISKNETSTADEWRNKANGRKIILYNTHLDKLLNDDEKFLHKLEYVFKWFEQKQDAVLLWRPHPLSEATMLAMNPKSYSLYMNLKEEFVQRKIGILDETSYLHLALEMADAYLGDISSLVELFRPSGKPILIQNYEVDNKSKTPEYLWVNFYDAYVDDDGMWFASLNYNSLFYRSHKTGCIEWIGIFPDEGIACARLYGKVVNYKKKLLFIPFNAKRPAVFHMESQSFTYIEIKDQDIQEKFYNYVLAEDTVLLLPRCYKTIIKIHMKDETVEYMDDWMDLVNPFVQFEKGMKFGYINMIGEQIYCPLYHKKAVLWIDMARNAASLHTSFQEDELCSEQFVSSIFDGKYWWLVSFDTGCVKKWRDGRHIDTIELFTGEGKDMKDKYAMGAVLHGREIWVLYILAGGIARLNIDTGNISWTAYNFQSYRAGYMDMDEFWSYINLGIRGDNLFLFPGDARKLLRMNLNTAEIYEEEIKVNTDNLLELVTGQFERNEPIYENYFFPLEDFIDAVGVKKKKVTGVSSIGGKIHEYISKEVRDRIRMETCLENR